MDDDGPLPNLEGFADVFGPTSPKIEDMDIDEPDDVDEEAEDPADFRVDGAGEGELFPVPKMELAERVLLSSSPLAAEEVRAADSIAA